MRLTDRLVVLDSDDEPVVSSVRCYMGHKGGGMTGNTEYQPIYYQERASAIVSLPETIGRLVLSNPTGYKVRHRNLIYRVVSAQARYRSHGRLNHMTLDLERPST